MCCNQWIIRQTNRTSWRDAQHQSFSFGDHLQQGLVLCSTAEVSGKWESYCQRQHVARSSHMDSLILLYIIYHVFIQEYRSNSTPLPSPSLGCFSVSGGIFQRIFGILILNSKECFCLVGDHQTAY